MIDLIKNIETDKIALKLINGDVYLQEFINELLENDYITCDEVRITKQELKYLLENYLFIYKEFKTDNSLKYDVIDTYEKLAYYIYNLIDVYQVTLKNNHKINKSGR